ncbi:hypothetical protein KR038_009258 [Drosophila bunnanda]|nr:hypothetical protein KR038_009258 [Drosophila bunnanda]
MIRRLEEQLQAAKDELQLHQKELQGMLLCLEEAKHLEATDKAKLEEEIMAKQMEDEVEEARRKRDLLEAQVLIRRLEEQLQAAKDELRRQGSTPCCRIDDIRDATFDLGRNMPRISSIWPSLKLCEGKKKQEYEDRLKQMQEEMKRSERDLLEAQEMIRRLEEQLQAA